MDPRTNLIPVFKAGNPDKKLYADQAQINANPDKLIKWDRRETWLAEQAKGASKQAAGKGAAKVDPAPEAEGDDTESAAEAPARTKAELHALLDEKGIPYTQRMTVPQLEELLK
jgi:hypothetical protein